MLSKTGQDLDLTLNMLEKEGISNQEAIKLIFECPKLVSIKNMEGVMDEVFSLFELYHRIERHQVMEIFRGFPYLFCCDTLKM